MKGWLLSHEGVSGLSGLMFGIWVGIWILLFEAGLPLLLLGFA